jgi:hypothetical protein
MARLNDRERELWVGNHESLYREWLQSGDYLDDFIKDNRDHIDKVINHELGRKPRG